MKITKDGAQSLLMKMPNTRVVFQRTHSYLSLRLLPACSKIARTKVKVGKTRLLSLVQLRAIFPVKYLSAVAAMARSHVNLRELESRDQHGY